MAVGGICCRSRICFCSCSLAPFIQASHFWLWRCSCPVQLDPSPSSEIGRRGWPSRFVAIAIRFASHVLIVSLLVPMSHAATVYPARGGADPHYSLSCSGGLVVLGDSKSIVYEKCGPPQNVDKGCLRGQRRSWWCWDIWMYRPHASYFPRYVSFNNDIVVGIQAGSRFD